MRSKPLPQTCLLHGCSAFLGVDEYANGRQAGSFAARVDITTGELLEVHRLRSGQVPFGGRDLMQSIKITKADPAWQAAVRRRGVEDMRRVQIDMWPGSGPLPRRRGPHPSSGPDDCLCA